MAKKRSRRFNDPAITTEDFPHAALTPQDAFPRITPENAGKLMDLGRQCIELGIGKIQVTPAIVVAVWQGPLVKYLVDDQQAEATIENLHRAIAEYHTAKAKETASAKG